MHRLLWFSKSEVGPNYLHFWQVSPVVLMPLDCLERQLQKPLIYNYVKWVNVVEWICDVSLWFLPFFQSSRKSLRCDIKFWRFEEREKVWNRCLKSRVTGGENVDDFPPKVNDHEFKVRYWFFSPTTLTAQVQVGRQFYVIKLVVWQLN